ncbi:NAD(P)-dependent dehydrogenase (short-subunit alcohol dehydrogenase family) [Pseudorhodobacter sp. 4114]|nr:NAD(P)-dependent dehydrogenase (short-subunit alcohol dehydrogenase family) [Pseudorhodobacter sp. 4114]
MSPIETPHGTPAQTPDTPEAPDTRPDRRVPDQRDDQPLKEINDPPQDQTQAGPDLRDPQAQEQARDMQSRRPAQPDYPKPPFPEQTQTLPGSFLKMDPRPDHGEQSWRGAGRLNGMVALITGGDSGIGRAVAIAYAREGADIALSYLDETEDAEDTARIIKDCGRQCLQLPGDISDAGHCRELVEAAVSCFGRIDILVNNAAHQRMFDALADIPDEEWERTFAINIHAMFYLSKAAVPHMQPGASIINTASVNADMPNPGLLAYATTKGAIQNFSAGLAQMLAEKDIRVNCVAPGPVWTPLIPASMPGKTVVEFGQNYPMKRPAQPVELASAYVMLAEPMSSYVSGATIAVTGGKPIL